MTPERRRLIVTADDFGLTTSVNEAVERAVTDGILTSASLMVSAQAATDAVVRARRLPKLAVGLHLVVIEGAPCLPPDLIPDLIGSDGRFPSDQFRLGVEYFFRPAIKRQLAAEIRAQFEAFRATGLTLDHANAHKHMHLHPTVGRMMIDIGREYGLRAIRVPAEPVVAGGPARTLGDRILARWCGVLRRQARHAGLITNDHVLGLGWTGHMTLERTQALLDALPPGLTELYFHPAINHDADLLATMSSYEHAAEFAALMGARLPAEIRATTFGEVGRAVGS